LKLVIAHQIEGRTRMRVQPGAEGEGDWFDFAGLLGASDGVDVAEYRPVTGSLVIEHPGLAPDQLETAISHLGGHIISPESLSAAAPSALMGVRRRLDRTDLLLGRLTAGGLDMRTLTFVILVGLAIRQLLAGQVMVPALTLLTWAVELLPKVLPQAQGQAAAADD